MRRRGKGCGLAASAVAGAVALAGCTTQVVSEDKPGKRSVRVETAGAPSRSQSPQSPSPRSQPPGLQSPRSQRPESQSPAPVKPGGPAPSTPGEVDVLAEKEPCAARLHDVAGVMLLYYALHKRLPARLEELRAVADIDQSLDFTCPASGRPYVYVPAGLRYPGEDERLVLYDAEPAHAGETRWGILAAPPKGERPAAMWAVQLTEAALNAYLASAAPAGGS